MPVSRGSVRSKLLLLVAVVVSSYSLVSKPVVARQGFAGGILEFATSTATRVLPTASQVGMPAGRGCITLPAPYNTTICKLTDNAADCNGQDCVQQEGYSNVSNCNYNAGEPVIKCFVGLQNTSYVTIFSIDKATRTVQKLGAVATSGPLSGRRGTLWFFSPSNKDLLYAFNSSSKMYECNISSLPASCVEFLDVQSPAAAAVHGLGTTNLRVGEGHPARDGDKFGLSLTNLSDQRDRGCLYYQKSTNTWKWIAHPNGTGSAGTINCHFSLDGNNVGAMLERPTGPLTTEARDWATMTQRWVLLDPAGSPGHQSAWWLGNCGADNYSPVPAAFRCWFYDRGGISSTPPYAHIAPQGVTVNQTSTWSPAASFNQISCLHQDGSAAKNWCSVTASEDPPTRNPSQPREGEVWLTSLDGTLRVITLAPTFRDVDSGGGADPYNRAPKPNTSGSGESIFWISNLGGSPRLEAFVVLDVDQAGERLLNWNGSGGPSDTTAPTVSMTAPAGGSTVGGTLTVSANASDNVAVIGVQFLLDGVNVGTEDITSPYAISWNSATTSNGNHTLTARARDAAGNMTTAAGVTVNVQNASSGDTTPPNVSLTAPANGATVSGTVTMAANATDNVGVVGVQFLVDGVNAGAEDTSSPYSVAWNSATVGNGNHTLAARARDAAGNVQTSAGITVNVQNANPGDSTPPTASLTAPAAGATLSGTTTVTATATDNVGVVGVQFLVDGLDAGAEDQSAPYSFAWNTAAYANGPHALSARARDAAGNTRTSAAVSVSVQNQGPADTTLPTVTMTAPANGAVVSGNTVLSANATDNVGVVGVQFRLDNNDLGPELAFGPFSMMWNAAGAAPGNHTLTAVARDAAGNSRTATAISVIVQNVDALTDTTPPNVSLMSPVDGARVSGSILVSANATDNVAVARVQFLIDGANFGAPILAPPYTRTWDTASVPAGTTHVLSAVAFDAAGNARTATAVSVIIDSLQRLYDTAAPRGDVQRVSWTGLVNARVYLWRLRKTEGCDNCADAGALSAQRIVRGDGYVEFAGSTSTKTYYVGFGPPSPGISPADIDFGIRVNGRTADVYEANAPKASVALGDGDTFRISVSGGVVSYSRNGTVFYTSQRSPILPLAVRTTLMDRRAEIGRALFWRPATATTPTASSNSLGAPNGLGLPPSTRVNVQPQPRPSAMRVPRRDDGAATGGPFARLAFDLASRHSTPSLLGAWALGLLTDAESNVTGIQLYAQPGDGSEGAPVFLGAVSADQSGTIVNELGQLRQRARLVLALDELPPGNYTIIALAQTPGGAQYELATTVLVIR